MAYMREAALRGIVGTIEMCNLVDGQGHAFHRSSDGRVLDVRHNGVISAAEVGCR